MASGVLIMLSSGRARRRRLGVSARAAGAVEGIISPPAGERSGAGRGRCELSIMGFGAGLRLEGGLSGRAKVELVCLCA